MTSSPLFHFTNCACIKVRIGVDSASVEEIRHALSLRDIKQRQVHVERTCAITGEKVAEAIEELARMVKTFQRTKDCGNEENKSDSKRRRKHSKAQ